MTKKKTPKKPSSKASASKSSGKSTKKTKPTKKKTTTKAKTTAKKSTSRAKKSTAKKATTSTKKRTAKKTVAKKAITKKATPKKRSRKKQKTEISASAVADATVLAEQAEEIVATNPDPEDDERNVHDEYKFKNYFESEPQLDTVDQDSEVADILAAYQRIIFVHAKRHLPPANRPGGMELDDLIAQGNLGLCDAIDQYRNPERKTPKYSFHMACLYKIRDHIYKYCIGNANQLGTPAYIQRGLMHVAQIFQLMQNQTVAEQILKRPGPASTQEIVEFIYDEDERLPLKSKTFIKKQINRAVSKKEFEQIYTGVMVHKRGSQHSYVKNNLSDVGKILHIKEKIWYTFKSNNMKYKRGIELILSARRSQTPLEDSLHAPIRKETVESKVAQRELYMRGVELCGEQEFRIVFDNICLGLSYEEIAQKHKMTKPFVTDTVKKCLRALRQDEVFIEYYKGLK